MPITIGNSVISGLTSANIPTITTTTVNATTVNTTTVNATALAGVSTLSSSTGTQVIDTSRVVSTSKFIRQVSRQYDSASRTFSTSFANGPSWIVSGIKKDSDIQIDLNVPHRNDSGSWGGFYMALWWSINGGASYTSLGTTGHENMQDSGADIFHYSNQFYISASEINASADYNLTILLRFRSYDGTLGINNGANHDVNAGGDSNQNGNSTHFWTNIIIYEYAKMNG